MKQIKLTMDERAIAIQDAFEMLRTLPAETESALIALVSALGVFCASLEAQQPGAGQEMRRALIANLEAAAPLVRDFAVVLAEFGR